MIKPIREGAVGQNQKVVYKLSALREFLANKTVEPSIEAALNSGMDGFVSIGAPFFAQPERRSDRGRAILISLAWGRSDTLELIPSACRRRVPSMRLRIQVSNFEAACRTIEALVSVAGLPESAARRHAQTMAIQIVPLRDEWSLRAMHIGVRGMEALPAFARDLVTLWVEDLRSPSPAA